MLINNFFLDWCNWYYTYRRRVKASRTGTVSSHSMMTIYRLQGPVAAPDCE